MNAKILRAVGELLQAVADEVPAAGGPRVTVRSNRDPSTTTDSYEIRIDPQAGAPGKDWEDDEIDSDTPDEDWDPIRKASLLEDLAIERRCRIHYDRNSYMLSPEGSAANLVGSFDTVAEAKAEVKHMKDDPLVDTAGDYCDQINALIDWAAGKGLNRPGGQEKDRGPEDGKTSG